MNAFSKSVILIVIALVLNGCGTASLVPSKELFVKHTAESVIPTTKPVIIAHRGASGYLPEHTLAAYQLAIDLGADYIEPDLVITKDAVLVARHDRYLSTSTDVATRAEFASRKTEKPGHEGADWFVEDFSLAELKTLRAVQPRTDRSAAFDGRFDIPTLEEILELANHNSITGGRVIGVYPETKHPAALEALGLSFDDALLNALEQAGYRSAEHPVFIQSFEADILKRLRARTSIRLVYLLAEPPHEHLKEIADFADAIGPWKNLLIDEAGVNTGLVERAHEAGLLVHPWTFRDDDIGRDVRTVEEEITQFLDIGIDGLFTDFADTGVRVRALWGHRPKIQD